MLQWEKNKGVVVATKGVKIEGEQRRSREN
jgi:hypothetical protein